MGSGGVLYGTTGESSTVFEMTPGRHAWRLQTIHRLCKQNRCRQGEVPSNLIADSSGNLYGTAGLGGLANSGTVFELSPGSGGNRWTFKMLHDFCTKGNCPDGQNPDGGLTYAGAASGQAYDGTSPLYGMTEYGGAANSGVAYEVVPSNNGKWSETVLHGFCSQPGCTDGSSPYGALIVDPSGNLYGTTFYGGADNSGTAFELGKGKKWSETVLYSFCSLESCTDGNLPSGALLMDGSGNLYGTTQIGGSEDKGVVYELTPDGSQWELTVLYTFCQLRNCADGLFPGGPLIMDASGNLYGVTEGGGTAREGTVFRLVPDGTQSKLEVLYSFCSQANCTAANPGIRRRNGSWKSCGTTEGGGDGFASSSN